MSLVVAIRTDEGIVMGCDTQVSYGVNKYSMSDNTSCKIWDIINCPHGIMGSVGMLRDSQLISAHPIIDPNRILNDDINFNYVVCELYSVICDILESYHRISFEPIYDKDGVFIPPILNNEFIFAYKDSAYQISQEGSVRTIDDYLVIGSGADIATGVLDNNYDKAPEERIIEAIACCNKNNLYIDNNVILSYTYEKDCENTNCKECERRYYCGYYEEELDEDGLPEEEAKKPIEEVQEKKLGKESKRIAKENKDIIPPKE